MLASVHCRSPRVARRWSLASGKDRLGATGFAAAGAPLGVIIFHVVHVSAYSLHVDSSRPTSASVRIPARGLIVLPLALILSTAVAAQNAVSVKRVEIFFFSGQRE